jgi:hypothetical protein
MIICTCVVQCFISAGEEVDWAIAEPLAFAALPLEEAALLL